MVGIINFKWHKACAVRGMGFTKDELAAGWPESFALERLAILQSPDDKKMANTWHRALKVACEANLPSAATLVRKIGLETRLVRGDAGFVRRNIYGERELDYREQSVTVMKDVEVPAVTAADFAAWLAALHEAPSEHISAWFDAVGLDRDTRPIEPPAPAVVIEPRQESPAKLKRRDLLTPVIERAQRECADPFDAPAVYAALTLLAESKVKPLIGGITEDGIQWVDEKGDPQCLSLKMLRGRLSRQKKGVTQARKSPLKRVK